MWIGSKVPPRIPVRTGPRIGPGRCHQPKRSADVGASTTHLTGWVDVPAIDPRGEMDPGHAVGAPGQPDDGAPGNPSALAGADLGQIREGDLEPRNRLDRDRSHPGDGSSKCHTPRSGGPHLIAHLCRVVDAPMAAVPSDRGIVGDHGPADWRAQTYGCDGEDDEHLSLKSNVQGGADRIQSVVR